MNNKIINLISNNNFISRKTSAKIKESLTLHGFHVTEKYSKEAVLNITVGGDGAFLRAVHRNDFPDIPFIGVNTGHLGFFQEILPGDIDLFVSKYILNEYSQEEMFLLETEIITSNKKHTIKSVNEIVIKTTESKVIHLDLYIDNNHLQKFSGDGLIISTPSGSTAYNYSVGGSIVYPTLNTMQITPIAPIISSAFRSLPNSIIIPGSTLVTIIPERRHYNDTLIVNDGDEIKLKKVEKINIKISNDTIHKLNFKNGIYWDNLKDKFL